MLTSLLPTKERMYKALIERDATFEGIFFAAIKTTGIFCRPGCTARKPKKENIEYFASTKEALSYGFRPCKICKPMELYGESPEWITKLLKDVRENPHIVIKDYQLRERGVEPATLRRWFKKHHGMTFHAYVRSLRINRAFGQLKQNEKIMDSALDSGYESLSGFNDAFKKLTGFSPSESGKKSIVMVSRILTNLGPMFAGSTEKGVCLLEFWDRRMIETQFRRLKEKLNAEFVKGNNQLLEELANQIEQYFDGKRKKFDVPLDLKGSDFQLKTWRALMEIPYGETRSYQEQAETVGDPKAVRAVARANGDNRLAIIIPCHRVIAKDGSLAGYGGGLWRKHHLLNLEKRYK